MKKNYSATKDILLLGITLNTSLGAIAETRSEALDEEINVVKSQVYKVNGKISEKKQQMIALPVSKVTKETPGTYALIKAKERKIANWCFSCSSRTANPNKKNDNKLS